jgi:multidrug transporter EmrE-like cation transporter
MIYLALAIICSASIALIFKHSEGRNMNRYAVTTANYIVAVIISVVMLGVEGNKSVGAVDLPGFFGIFQQMILYSQQLDREFGQTWAIVSGLFAGFVFFLGFIYYQISVRRYGMSLAGTFIKLGILVPMALSLLFWREYPSTLQWFGMGLAVLSIVLVNNPASTSGGGTLRPALLLLFLFGGLAEFSNKIFQNYGYQEDKSLFLLATFGVAGLCSAAATAIRNRHVTVRDLLVGGLVGIPNLFASYFLILALDAIPAAVAFPVFGAGTVVIINLVGLLVYRERLSRSELAAIGLTVIAMVLINV